MKKTILSGIACLVYFSMLFAQNKAIQFESGTWKEVLEKAQRESKPVFVDAFTTWCGPCKWMAKNVFTNDTVADFYNTHFINAQIDMEKGEGEELSKQWEVKVYPSLLYFSPDGEMLHRACGAGPSGEFVQLGKEALNPETQIATARKKYESGTTDMEFIASYVALISKSCVPAEKESKQYFATQKDEDLTAKRNWELIKNTVSDIDSREFTYLEAHKTDFEKLYEAKEIRQKINEVYERTLMDAIYKDKAVGYEVAKAKVLAKKSVAAVKAVAYADMTYYQQKDNWTKYADAATNYINRYEPDNGTLLNNAAYTFYSNISDKAQLAKALEWAKRSVELKEDGANLDTYASLLYKTGNKTAAIENEKKAIALAKAAGNDGMVKELEKTLQKFESK